MPEEGEDHIPIEEPRIDYAACKRRTDPTTAETYPLTLEQWKYLNGDRERGSPSEIREKKVERLSDRFEHLLEDITLLHEQDIFEEGHEYWENWDWTEVWKDMVSLSYSVKRDIVPPLHSRSISSITGRERVFGIKMGRCLKYMSDPVPESDQFELFWGIFLGLFMSESKRMPQDDMQQFQELRQIAIQLNKQLLLWRKMGKRQAKQIEMLTESAQKPNEIMEDVLSNHGISMTRTIKERIESEVDLARPFLGASEEKRENEQIAVEDLVETLTEETELEEIESLLHTIRNDMEELAEKEYFSEQALELFEDVCDAKGPIHGREIEERKSEEHKKHLLKVLSGRKQESPWKERPVLKERNSRWELSMYGELLCYIFTNISDVDNWLHQYVFADGEISKQEKQLIEHGLSLTEI